VNTGHEQSRDDTNQNMRRCGSFHARTHATGDIPTQSSKHEQQ